MSDRYIGEPVTVDDVEGLIDPDTGNIDTAIMPALSGNNYASASQANRLAGTHTGGTVVGGFVVGDLVYQIDTSAYWIVTSLPSSVQANWNPWSIIAATTDTGGGAGNAGKVFVGDSAGKLDGRDVGADGSKLDGIEAGADVTDAANVDAAGAVMNADYTATDVVLVGSGVGTTTTLTLTANTALAKRGGATVANSIGVAASTDLLDRAGGDGRYDAVGAASTVAGSLTSHLNDTTDAHLAGAIGYTPADGSKWTNPDPTTVAGGLDTLAARVNGVEQGGSGSVEGVDGTRINITTTPYTITASTTGETRYFRCSGAAASVILDTGFEGQVLTVKNLTGNINYLVGTIDGTAYTGVQFPVTPNAAIRLRWNATVSTGWEVT